MCDKDSCRPPCVRWSHRHETPHAPARRTDRSAWSWLLWQVRRRATLALASGYGRAWMCASVAGAGTLSNRGYEKAGHEMEHTHANVCGTRYKRGKPSRPPFVALCRPSPGLHVFDPVVSASKYGARRSEGTTGLVVPALCRTAVCLPADCIAFALGLTGVKQDLEVCPFRRHHTDRAHGLGTSSIGVNGADGPESFYGICLTCRQRARHIST